VSDQSKPPESSDPRIAAALREYLERLDRGESVSHEEFLSRHAEITEALRSLIAVEDELRKLAGADPAGKHTATRSTDHLDRLTVDQRAIVEERVQAFKDAWQRGERPAIVRYLPAKPPARTAAQIELVHLDLKHRFDAGEPRQVSSYVAEFPLLADDQRQLAELKAADSELRKRFATTATRDSEEWQQSLPAAGDKVRYFGDYELLEQIARGGMGVVYKARQVSLNRVVALKMILAGQLASEREVERFYTEAQAAANLQHPNIVAIHEVGQHVGQHYFSMDYVAGKSLAQLVREKPFAAVQAARYVKTIAEAIEYAHQHGTLHRDLKPANVLIDTFDQPRVTDFGLAKRIEGTAQLTSTGSLMGTPSYMPPEQAGAHDGKVGPASDVYSLGAVLYELVTGRPPFLGESLVVTLNQVLNTEPVPPRLLNPEIPRDLETVCLKCLQKEPGKRYQTAAELAGDLRRFLKNEPILARPVGAIERTWRWCLRNPVVASLGAAIAMLLLISAVGGTTLATLATREARRADQNAKRADQNSERVAEEAQKVAEEAQKAEAEKIVAVRRMAESYVDRGLRLCDEGEAPKGLLWLARALEVLPSSTATVSAGSKPKVHGDAFADPERALRANLAAWSQSISPVKACLRHQSKVSRAFGFSPDGKMVLTATEDELRLWDAATGRPIGAPLQQQQQAIALFSRDGKTILTVGEDKTVRLWDATTAKLIRAPLSDHGTVSSFDWSPDGKTVVTGGADNTARLWDLATGKPIGAPLLHGPVTDVAYCPNGKTVLTENGRTAQTWDVATGKPIGAPMQHQRDVRAVAFSPDGKTVLTGSWDETARLWDAATGKPIGMPLQHQSTADMRRRHVLAAVRAIAVSPDGKTVLTTCQDDAAHLWDAATGKPISPPLQHTGMVNAATFSPDGKTVLTGSGDRTARFWDTTTGKSIGAPLQHQNSVNDVAYSPDGKTVMTGCDDETVRLWEAHKANGALLQHQAAVMAIAFSPDGTKVLTGSGYIEGGSGQARLWDAATGSPIGSPLQHQNSVVAVSFSPDGKTILTGSLDGTARLWDSCTGKPMSPPLLRPPESLPITSSPVSMKQLRKQVSGFVFSPDGKTIVICSNPPRRKGLRRDDGTVQLWDTATGRPIGTPLRHHGWVWAFVFSPDGKTVATGSEDKTARLWGARTGKPIGTPLQHPGEVTRIAFSPDGNTVVTGSKDGTARLWDARTGKPIGTPLQHHGEVTAVAFSPEGKTIVTGGRDGTTRLWDARTGKQMGPPLEHQRDVRAVAFSPDGKTVLTGSWDGTAQLWDVVTCKPIGPRLRHHDRVSDVVYSPSGKTVLTGSFDNTAQLWPAPVPVEGAPERITCWLQVLTNMEIDEGGAFRALSGQEWLDRRSRLEALGGPPVP
jgi:WD40 repeat protein/tRNA A-37 threonylcarbamoyl transferase component Bud32